MVSASSTRASPEFCLLHMYVSGEDRLVAGLGWASWASWATLSPNSFHLPTERERERYWFVRQGLRLAVPWLLVCRFFEAWINPTARRCRQNTQTQTWTWTWTYRHTTPRQKRSTPPGDGHKRWSSINGCYFKATEPIPEDLSLPPWLVCIGCWRLRTLTPRTPTTAKSVRFLLCFFFRHLYVN